MMPEPAQPIADGPIEKYLDRVRDRLMVRHDTETVDTLLAEFHAHLVESAAEVSSMGFRRIDAERRAIELFGGRDIEHVAASMAASRCSGDRTWGRIALGWGLSLTFGSCMAMLHREAFSAWPAELLRALFVASLLFYGFACLKAKRYAMGRALAAGGAALLAVFAMIPVEPNLTEAAFFTPRPREALLAVRDPSWLDIQSSAPVVVASSEGSKKGLLEAIRRSVIEEAAKRRDQGSVAPRYDQGLQLGSEAEVGLAIGSVPLQPMPGLLQVEAIVPQSIKLGAQWLLFALITRAVAQWLARCARNLDAGVYLS